MTMTLEEVPDPVPGPGEVLVSVHAVGICGSDVHGFIGKTGRRKPPMVMGHEATGVVAQVGAGVTHFKPGDRVVLNPILSCDVCRNCRAGRPNICLDRHALGVDLPGAYADYVQLAERMLWPMPDELSFVAGALVEPLAVAMHAVNLTPIRLMDTVAIVGAGTIGLLTLMAAKLAGAGTVIVTDKSVHRLDVAKRLGADVTINVDKEEPLPIVQSLTHGDRGRCRDRGSRLFRHGAASHVARATWRARHLDRQLAAEHRNEHAERRHARGHGAGRVCLPRRISSSPSPPSRPGASIPCRSSRRPSARCKRRSP